MAHRAVQCLGRMALFLAPRAARFCEFAVLAENRQQNPLRGYEHNV